MARQGSACTVIQPVAVHHAFLREACPFQSREDAGGGRTVEVFRPRYVSLSAQEAFARLGPLSPSLFTLGRFTAAVRRVTSSAFAATGAGVLGVSVNAGAAAAWTVSLVQAQMENLA